PTCPSRSRFWPLPPATRWRRGPDIRLQWAVAMKTVLSGVLLIIATLAAAGCASTGPSPRTPPTVDGTRNWAGTWVPMNAALASGAIQMTLQQSGALFTGTILMTGGIGGGNIFAQGIVFGDRVRVMQPPGWLGDFVVQGNTMSGTILPSGITMS